MTTFRQVADAWVAAKDLHNGELSRLAFWVDEFGARPIESISEVDVDHALCERQRRGKMKRGAVGIKCSGADRAAASPKAPSIDSSLRWLVSSSTPARLRVCQGAMSRPRVELKNHLSP
jgi:hypothetical protein